MSAFNDDQVNDDIQYALGNLCEMHIKETMSVVIS